MEALDAALGMAGIVAKLCADCHRPVLPRACPGVQVEGVVYVAQGREHPALLCTTALLRTPHWLSPQHAQQLAERGSLRCHYKARYGQQPKPCTVFLLNRQAAAAVAAAAAAGAAGNAAAAPAAGGVAALFAAPGSDAPAAGAAEEAAAAAEAQQLGFAASAYCRLHPDDSRTLPTYLVVAFDEPAAAITPQQACVLYDGEVCLGAALIAQPGRSLHELAAPSQAAAALGAAAADAG